MAVVKYQSIINLKIKLLLIYLTPCIVFIIYGLYINFNNLLNESFDFIILECLFFFFAILFKNKIIKSVLFNLCYLILCLNSIIKLGFFHIFKTNFNASNVFILLETNLNESQEFISLYFDSFIWALILILLMSFITVFIISNTSLIKLNAPNKKELLTYISVISICCCLLYYNKQQNLLFIFYREYNEYLYELGLNDKNLSSTDNKTFTNVHCEKDSLTVIVVIGESLNRNHMSIYGYSKNTTPLLKKRSPELYIFNDVISSNCTTTQSLLNTLTLNEQNQRNNKNATIIQLFNMAGFRTYWLSNQKPIGIYESPISVMTKACYKKYFLNTSTSNEKTPYDEVVLKYYDKVLSDKYQKKIIFIHLMGSHSLYSKRYPEKFNYYKPDTESNSNLYKSNMIKTYDNSIVYNDFIINTLITQLKLTNNNSVLLYFSDHGEEVYDTINFDGHSEEVGTKSMYEIPFIVWMSEKMKNKLPIDLYENNLLSRKIINDNLIYSIADITEVKFDQQNLTKSIFSPIFEEKIRLIKNRTLNYDSL